MECPTCKGTGKIRDLMHEVTDPCALCEGKGHVDDSKIFDHIGDDATLVFKFPTKKAALAFKSYLCHGGGEERFLEGQDYLVDEGDLKPEDRVKEFVYHTGDNTIIGT